ncbi:hypothetical protein L195_g048543 [Trifolium pratense]|uniref:Uncharacterized protein n=1 Tax=Trifolium pratense TaxID=57577 RepID=A0A2K3JLK9_TRIPR|nr:hypothetical protein L195_g048543 [Trifolium pratense]
MPGQGFCEAICKLIFSENMLNPNLVIANMISDKVNIDSNVFHATMEDRVDDEVSGTEIVTVDGRNYG